MGNRENMTERQREDWPKAIEEINRYHVGATDNPDHYDWHFDWAEEVKPGRGQSFSALFVDGEHFAQVMMDVYGYPTVSVCALDLLHNGSDEECPCSFCVEDRFEGYTPEEREAEEAAERLRRFGSGRIPRHRELVTVPGPDEYSEHDAMFNDPPSSRREMDHIEKVLGQEPDYSRIKPEHFEAADRAIRGGYLAEDPAPRPSLWQRFVAWWLFGRGGMGR